MNLTKIRYFVEVASCGSFSGAAQKLYTSQPNVSKQIAQMEQELDSVEEGKTPWKSVIRSFYGDFTDHLTSAEKSEYVKVPDTVSEEVCPVCGRHLVEKEGRFGPFLACPGFPECSFTMPLVVQMPGRCPKCGGRLMKRTGVSKKSGKQYTYYCCENTNRGENGSTCDFMTWDVPVKDDCPECGQTMFKRAGRGFKRPFCINAACSRFLPEEKRGYYKKTDAAADQSGEKKPASGRAAAAKKTAKTTGAAKKTAAKTAKTASAKKTTKRTTK